MHFDSKCRIRWVALHFHAQFIQICLKYVSCEALCRIRWNVGFKFAPSLIEQFISYRDSRCFQLLLISLTYELKEGNVHPINGSWWKDCSNLLVTTATSCMPINRKRGLPASFSPDSFLMGIEFQKIWQTPDLVEDNYT